MNDSASGAETGPRLGWIERARPLLREPLVYFVVLGALVFGVDHALRRDEQTIRVTPAVRAEIVRALTVRLSRAPSAEEQQVGLEQWKEEQALYREGVRMGLLEDDPTVRSQIAAKLFQVAQERTILPEATDAQLHDYLRRHWNEYRVPAEFDFDQVFISQTRSDAKTQAEQALDKLRAGAPTQGLGDWFPRGEHFTQETLQDVGPIFGEEAARQMPKYALGEWNLVSAPRGFHLLRVTAVDPGEPDFDKLRKALVSGFEAERRQQAAQAYVREVESRYRFLESP